ncbi:MAG: AAA family ATPase [Actinomycetota bacterium]|nr:AAA family ATPase [Actinomycetota bacterium]
MATKIVSTGRGGAGKSTFVSLISRYLNSPMLLIDLDPDQSLPDMVGADLEKEKVSTVSAALNNILEERKSNASLAATPLPEKMEYVLQAECLYEDKNFDLITLGTKLTRGCYCAPDDILKMNIPRLAEKYSTVIIDSPAGLEHLNRKVFSSIDDLFILLDPSSKSIKHIGRVEAITRAIGIKYNHLYLIGNYRFDESLEKKFSGTGGVYLGKIEKDDNVEKYNIDRKPLLDLPEDSPACISVRKILKKAGYLK